uniref:Alternative protein TMEM237 n=1 Tax=Homo sapiens TaxID=9606 RepID=L0R6S1_HUMAN|nr:alternative protein TMEM237 [Homo sapiens]
MGKNVSKAVEHINKTIEPALISKHLNVIEQKRIDKLMIETVDPDNRSKFGVNIILGISFAVCKAGAAEKGFSLLSQNCEFAGNSEGILLVPAFTVTSNGSQSGNKLAV